MEKRAIDYIGKLVVVSHWGDFDMWDAVGIGYLEKIDDEGYFYLYGSKRGWRFMRPVHQKIFSCNKFKHLHELENMR